MLGSVECTSEIDFVCPPFVSWLARSKKPFTDGQVDSVPVYSVLPMHRCGISNVCYSSSGSAFAYQQGQYLFIHRDSGELIDTLDLPYKATKIEFSHFSYDSFFLLLVASYGKGELDVWSIPKDSNPESEESEILLHLQFDLRYDDIVDNKGAIKQQFGFDGVFWVPQNENGVRLPFLLVVLEHRISAMVYSLEKQTSHMIPSPISSKRGISFHPTAPLVAFLHRPLHTDFILVYSTTTWKELFRIECETTQAEDLYWCGTTICVWDTYLECAVYWYNLLGLRVGSFKTKQKQLGIKAVDSYKDTLLVLGCYDESIRLIQATSRKLLKKEVTGSLIPYGHPAIVYQETRPDALSPSHYNVQELPFLIPSVQVSFKTGSEFPQVGVGLVKISHNGAYIAFRNDNMPQALWIFDVCKRVTSSILVQNENILNAHWNTHSCQLAFCTGSNQIFFWTPEGCSCVPCGDENFTIFDLQWNPKGSSLMLLGDTSFVLSFTS
uniref:Uncharacterized protein n=1 Tax=Vannella robusta TaxID=1487602 RepID=A0A7S4IE57_9EUKA|mmetsp:Transcript_24474/g.31135  ORF Transcript_24474/g.31135 Transcript_24474/m.31135 type:complete len:495 (+) Transcript_24474:130-1614(+)